MINGPNLNFLGRRDQVHYGGMTLRQIETLLHKRAAQLGVKLVFFQSNHEGALIDFIQAQSPSAQGIIINPGALTHYGYSLHDALCDTNLPSVEVHLSDILKREPFRRSSVIKAACVKQIMGKKEKSYILALEFLAKHILKNIV